MVFGGFSPFYDTYIYTGVPGSTPLNALFLQKGMARHTACYVSKTWLSLLRPPLHHHHHSTEKKGLET